MDVNLVCSSSVVMRKAIKHIDDLSPGIQDVKVLLQIDEVEENQGTYECRASDSTGEVRLIVDSALGAQIQVRRFYWALVQNVTQKGHMLEVRASGLDAMATEDSTPSAHGAHAKAGPNAYTGRPVHTHGDAGAPGNRERQGEQGQAYRRGQPGAGGGGYPNQRSGYGGGNAQQRHGYNQGYGDYNAQGAGDVYYGQGYGQPQYAQNPYAQAQRFPGGGAYAGDGRPDNAGRCAPQGSQQRGAPMNYGY